MSLIQRAQAIASRKSAVLAIVPLVVAVAEDPASAAVPGPTPTFSYMSGYATLGGQSGPSVGFVGGSTSAAPNGGISLFGNTQSVTGDTYSQAGGPETLHWQGGINGNADGRTVESDYLFTITLTPGASGGAGQVDWNLTDFFGNGTNSAQGTVTDTKQIDGSFDVTIPVPAGGSAFTTDLTLNWSGFASDAKLAVDVPGGSTIDLFFVPEPGTAGLIAVLGVVALGRARWRGLRTPASP